MSEHPDCNKDSNTKYNHSDTYKWYKEKDPNHKMLDPKYTKSGKGWGWPDELLGGPNGKKFTVYEHQEKAKGDQQQLFVLNLNNKINLENSDLMLCSVSVILQEEGTKRVKQRNKRSSDVKALVLLDPGSLAGTEDFISMDLVNLLKAKQFIVPNNANYIVCSGVDSNCFSPEG